MFLNYEIFSLLAAADIIDRRTSKNIESLLAFIYRESSLAKMKDCSIRKSNFADYELVPRDPREVIAFSKPKDRVICVLVIAC